VHPNGEPPAQPPEGVNLSKEPPRPPVGWSGPMPHEAMRADVGQFRQGSELSQWVLARYLVGRAVGESLGLAMWLFGLLLLAGAGVLWWQHWDGSAIFLAFLAVLVLLLRSGALALLRRLTALPVDRRRLGPLLADTRSGVLRELRRLGLPGRTWTLPLLALRLLRPRRRRETLLRLRGFDLDRAVPRSRLDELHLLLLRRR
jgi:hypothetical protein